MKIRKNGKHRGFTLTESVIAMVLTLLLIAAAVSTVSITIKAVDRLEISKAAVHESENILTSFRSNDFGCGLKLLYLQDFNLSSESVFCIYFDKNNKFIPQNSPNVAVWQINCTLSNEGKTIKISAVREADGEVIYETFYTKA